jgi:hypothetical protein
VGCNFHGGQFISPGWRQSRKASGLRVVLSAEYLNAARNVLRQRRHTWDRGWRLAVPASVLSFSFGHDTLRHVARTAQYGTLHPRNSQRSTRKPVVAAGMCRATQRHSARRQLPLLFERPIRDGLACFRFRRFKVSLSRRGVMQCTPAGGKLCICQSRYDFQQGSGEPIRVVTP